MSKHLIIMYSYARSGGTLLNKCLASFPDNIVISEVNPFGGGMGKTNNKYLSTVKGQMAEWYGLELKSKTYEEQVLELLEYCEANNKYLILRDWVYLSFNQHDLDGYQPSMQLDTLEMFSKHTDVKAFCVMRNALDVWISMGRKPLAKFLETYTSYVNQILASDIEVFKYEDFCRTPHAEMEKIANFIEVPYYKEFTEHFSSSLANGDTQVKDTLRSQKKVIQPLKRKPIWPTEFVDFLKHKKKINNINAKFSYNSDYFDDLTFFEYSNALISKITHYKK